MSTQLIPFRPTSQPIAIQSNLISRVQQSILDPKLFASTWLNTTLWDKQNHILDSIATHPKTVVKACHASSKTFTAAIATLWWLARYDEATVVTTAPTANQVEKLLWAEIHKLIAKSKYPFPTPTTTSLKINSKRYAVGFTTKEENQDKGVKFQGFHNRNVLVIFDEGPGVPGSFWDSVEGILASGNSRLLALGNPVISSGPFYDAFGINRSVWDTFSISAFDTPNFKDIYLEYKDSKGKTSLVGNPSGKNLLELTPQELAYNPAPYLITRQWVKDRYTMWGPTHPLFISRVLGLFPTQSSGSLFNIEWLSAAKDRPVYRTGKRLRAGIDVAGPGEDETTLWVVDGPNIVLSCFWPDADPRGEIVQALNPFKNQLDNVNVDTIGIGYYLARHLEDWGFPVSDINVGLPARDNEVYKNLKAEMYWGLRMRAASGDLNGALDDVTIAQLAGIRYDTNSRGQIYIEDKEHARKRGVKSPDRAEGLMLAFATPPQHGLIQLWQEQAEVIKDNMNRVSIEVQNPSISIESPTNDNRLLHELLNVERNNLATELASAQKAALPEHTEMFNVSQVNNLGKVMTVSNQGPVCPKCGNKFIGIFAEGRWRCNACGARGDKESLTTT